MVLFIRYIVGLSQSFDDLLLFCSTSMKFLIRLSESVEYLARPEYVPYLALRLRCRVHVVEAFPS